MVTPNIFAFRSRFPEFDSTDDAEIMTSLQIAGLFVDPLIWSVEDFAMAVLLFAAHFLQLRRQQLVTVQFGNVGGSNTFVRSIGIGERRVMFGELRPITGGGGNAARSAFDDLFNQSMYGMLYLALRENNVPHVMVI